MLWTFYIIFRHFAYIFCVLVFSPTQAAYDEQAVAAAARAEVDEALAACERARAAAVAQCESLQASFANQQVCVIADR